MKTTIGNLTTTESRQTTEMIEGVWTSLQESELGYEVLKEYLEKDVLNEQGRWFDIEEGDDGRKFATTGTVDLDYYIEVTN